MIWWIFPAAVGVLGLVILMTGLARFMKLKVATGTTRTLGGGMLLAGALVLALIGVNLQTYSRLNSERSVAIVDLTLIEPQYYQAQVKFADRENFENFDIRGDEIAFQARVIKWTRWANIVGYDSIFRLDRLQGQYTSVAEEVKKPRTVYPVRNEPGIDAFELVRNRGGWIKAVDAYYGSATYVPMVDGASYEIIMTQTGLMTRPLNDEARTVLKKWIPPTSKADAEKASQLPYK